MANMDLTEILLVEDDDGHARLIKETFAEAGVANPLIRLKDGQDAWSFVTGKAAPCLEPGRAYLMLLDIRMPGMDGLELLGLLKGDSRFKNMPVIMLTTTDDPKEIARCYGLGCNGYFVKPLDSERFTEEIKILGRFIKALRVGKPGRQQ